MDSKSLKCNRREFLKAVAIAPVCALAVKFGSSTAKSDRIAEAYRKYLGREASREEIVMWLSADYEGSQLAIANSPEAQLRAQ